MGVNLISEGVQGALHAIAGVLLVPVMVVLVALVVYILVEIGMLIAEHRTEHRHLSASMPDLMDAIDESQITELPNVIRTSGLLARQRAALLTLVAHCQLPLDDLVALARQLSYAEQEKRDRVLGRTDFVAKVSPMVGLMGTLIPLGPGILALSTGDTATLSSALLIAFDTTTAGLVVAAIAMGISRVRLRWYGRYATDLDAAATAIVRRVRDASEGERAVGAAAARESGSLGLQAGHARSPKGDVR